MAKAVERKESKKLSKMERIKQRMKARQNHDFSFLIPKNIKNNPELKLYFEFIELLTTKNVKLRGYIMTEYIAICVKEYAGNLVSVIIPKNMETANMAFTNILRVQPLIQDNKFFPIMMMNCKDNRPYIKQAPVFSEIDNDKTAKKYIFDSMNDFIIIEEFTNTLLVLDNEYKWNSIFNKKLPKYRNTWGYPGTTIIEKVKHNNDMINTAFWPTKFESKLSWIQYNGVDGHKIFELDKMNNIQECQMNEDKFTRQNILALNANNIKSSERLIVGCYVDEFELAKVVYCVYNSIQHRAKPICTIVAQKSSAGIDAELVKNVQLYNKCIDKQMKDDECLCSYPGKLVFIRNDKNKKKEIIIILNKYIVLIPLFNPNKQNNDKLYKIKKRLIKRIVPQLLNVVINKWYYSYKNKTLYIFEIISGSTRLLKIPDSIF